MEVNGKLTDNPNYDLIDIGEISYRDLYRENGLSGLEKYYNGGFFNHKIQLYGGRFIGIDKDCIKENNIDLNSKEAFAKKFDDVIYHYRGSIIGTLVMGYVSLLMFIILVIIFIIKRKEGEDDDDEKFKEYYITIAIYHYINFIVSFVMGLVFFPYKGSTIPLCYDSYTNAKIQEIALAHDSKPVFIMQLAASIFSLFMAIFASLQVGGCLKNIKERFSKEKVATQEMPSQLFKSDTEGM